MRLNELTHGLGLRLLAGSPDTVIDDVTDDSRSASARALFVARGGAMDDGRRYIRDAIGRGAAAIVCDRAPAPDETAGNRVAWLVGEAVNQPLAGQLAERFFGHPSRTLKVIGITGTNGKTTTAFIVQHLLNQAGVRCGMIGTVYNDDGVTRAPAPLTTPGAIELSRRLAGMVANGCGAVVAELSSHALDQGRTAALDIDVAVFTNLTGDHIDYHQTIQRYAAAKAVLFNQLKPTGWAVINVDGQGVNEVTGACRAQKAWCTATGEVGDSGAWHRAAALGLAADHSRVRLDGPWGSIEIRLPLIGRHNMMNALQAAAAANTVTPMARCLRRALETCPHVPGRLERVTAPVSSTTEQPTVLVDYAHTHDALENVLSAMKPLTRGRLIVMFGCGGDRDRTKRPLMAVVACAWAHVVIITSDNPRTEDPQSILADILSGVPVERRDAVTVEPDRAKAIVAAIAQATGDDVVILAGKGHEDYQIIGTTKRHFDDREHAAEALRTWRPKPVMV